MIINLGNAIRAEVISSVIGQLSDGIWENSSGMNKYWMFAFVDGTNLEIDDEPFTDERDYSTSRSRYGGFRLKRINNGFYGKSESDIKNWFANKAKQVVKIWAEDNGLDPVEVWNRDNTDEVSYMGGHKVSSITVADVYECYDFLKGRTSRKSSAPKSVEPQVSGGMNPSQQEVEDFFTGASTKIRGRRIKANSSYADEQIKDYIRSLVDAGDDFNLIFEVGGRFPKLTIHDLTSIVSDLYNEGCEIPGVEY